MLKLVLDAVLLLGYRWTLLLPLAWCPFSHPFAG